MGQSLIQAASIRAQVTQFEHFNSAVATFRTKFNGRPGDIAASEAAAFGLHARAGTDGQGDNDGLIESCASSAVSGCEFVLFWADLSQANLIKESLLAQNGDDEDGSATTFEESLQYFPRASVGDDSTVSVMRYLYVPYFDIARVAAMGPLHDMKDASINTVEAYQIDIKIDDGLPYSGTALAGNPYGLIENTAPLPLIPNDTRCADVSAGSVIYNVDRPELLCRFIYRMHSW
ncbi:MAG: hypothetical protein AB7L92_00135 [Alphaproteobacteria bacterium]